MSIKYLDSRIVDLPRSQWRYVQAAPARWLVMGLILSIVVVAVWWSVAPQVSGRRLPTSDSRVAYVEPARVGFCKTQ